MKRVEPLAVWDEQIRGKNATSAQGELIDAVIARFE
jgi:hypothetical protein